MSSLDPCEMDEDENPEITELRELINEYDDLFERCMTSPLSYEDQKTLDELYACLLLKEHEYWDGVSDEIYELILDKINLDFPMIRQILGMLPITE